jgi:hypothetical protein
MGDARPALNWKQRQSSNSVLYAQRLEVTLHLGSTLYSRFSHYINYLAASDRPRFRTVAIVHVHAQGVAEASRGFRASSSPVVGPYANA